MGPSRALSPVRFGAAEERKMRTRTWFLFASIPPWCASSGRAVAFFLLLAGGSAAPTQPSKIVSLVPERTTRVTEQGSFNSTGKQATFSVPRASIRADGRWVMLSSRPVRRVHSRP